MAVVVPERNEFIEEEISHARAMRGIGKFLLLDEGVILKPVEELGAVGANHLSLRIVDVGVDEAGGDETAGVVVDDCARRSASKNIGRFAHCLDQTAGDEHRSIFDERIGARAALGGIVGERQNAATDHASGGGQGKMSFSLSAAIRSISASAVVVSVSASLARRPRKAARMSAVLLPLTATMNGKPKRVR